MRVNWTETTLGNACSIARGGSPRPIQAFLTEEEDGINWVKISDATVSGKYIYETAEKIMPAGAARSRRVKDGDFLLSNSMSFGRPYIMRTSGCVHDGWLVLSGYKDVFDQDFLYHLLGSPQVFSQFDRLAAGSTVRNLNIELASRVVVPVPPLHEQRRIVDILEEALEGITTAKASAEKNLRNARKLFDEYMREIFSRRGDLWVDRTLDQVCKVERGSSPRPIKEFFTTESNGVNWIKIGDTQEGEKYVYSTAQKITPQGALQSRFVKEGDFILTNSMSFGRPYIMKTNGYIHDGWFVLRLREEVDADYFYYLLSSPFVQSQFQAMAAGAIVKNISGDLVKRTILTIPPLNVQKEIVGRFVALNEKTNHLSKLFRRKLASLDELKNSLLHQAFSGQL